MWQHDFMMKQIFSVRYFCLKTQADWLTRLATQVTIPDTHGMKNLQIVFNNWKIGHIICRRHFEVLRKYVLFPFNFQSFFGLNFGQNADIDIILDDQVTRRSFLLNSNDVNAIKSDKSRDTSAQHLKL
jgi:hypothetical protein